MKTLIITTLAATAVVLAPAAAAGPAVCDGHGDHGDQWGMPPGSKYVTACAGDAGPDWANNAQVPHVGWGDNG